MSNNKQWTKEEDQTLVEIIRDEDNTAKACKKASKQLDRTPSACSSRWHNSLKRRLVTINMPDEKEKEDDNYKQSIINILSMGFSCLSKDEKMAFIEKEFEKLIKN